MFGVLIVEKNIGSKEKTIKEKMQQEVIDESQYWIYWKPKNIEIDEFGNEWCADCGCGRGFDPKCKCGCHINNLGDNVE